jgi:hypothetical protein
MNFALKIFRQKAENKSIEGYRNKMLANLCAKVIELIPHESRFPIILALTNRRVTEKTLRYTEFFEK